MVLSTPKGRVRKKQLTSCTTAKITEFTRRPLTKKSDYVGIWLGMLGYNSFFKQVTTGVVTFSVKYRKIGTFVCRYQLRLYLFIFITKQCCDLMNNNLSTICIEQMSQGYTQL